MKEVLSEYKVKYLFVDICESVGKLKLFLKVRDTAEVMEDIRKEHRAGIPCLVVDDEVIPLNGPDHAREIIDKYKLAED